MQQERNVSFYTVEPEEVSTREERIQELEKEILSLKGGGSGMSSKALMQMLENPRALGDKFGLNEQQAVNVSSIITGVGAGMGRKYLTKMIGAELSGAVGGFLGALVSKKLFGA